MTAIVRHNADDLPYYEGPHAIDGIRFRGARAALGVTAWGMNVLDIAAGCEGYPAHDHAADGQEEVYVVLSGTADLVTGDDRLALREGDFVRVPPALNRTFRTTTGVRLLALGGTPGKAYEPTPGM